MPNLFKLSSAPSTDTTVDDTPGWQVPLIAAGRTIDESANTVQTGVRAAAAKLATAVGADDFAAAQNELLAHLSQQRAANAQAYAPLQQAYPVSTAIGGAAPVALAGAPYGMVAGGLGAMGWNQLMNRAYPAPPNNQ
jgi:hypothetical protein